MHKKTIGDGLAGSRYRHERAYKNILKFANAKSARIIDPLFVFTNPGAKGLFIVSYSVYNARTR